MSVVVVTYRSEAYIEACLESLPAAADGLAFDVIVVDNSPDDATSRRVRERFPGCRLIRPGANLGFARGINLGARTGRGRYLLLLNPDTRMAPGSLRRLAAALDHDAAVVAAGPLLVSPDGRPQVSARPRHSALAVAFESLMLDRLFPRSRFAGWACGVVPMGPAPGSSRRRNPPGGLGAEELCDVALRVECLSGACLLVRRSSFEALGGLDERFFLYGEDVDFCLRASQAGLGQLLLADARVEHAVAASSRLDPRRFQVDLHRAKAQLIEKHATWWTRSALLCLFVAGLSLRASVRALFGVALRRPGQIEVASHELAALASILASLSTWPRTVRRIPEAKQGRTRV